MDAKYIEEIKAREQAATAGPWVSGGCIVWVKDGDMVCDMSVAMKKPEQTEANTSFVSHARTDIPALIAEVKTLAADKNRISSESIMQQETIEKQSAEIITLSAENKHHMDAWKLETQKNSEYCKEIIMVKNALKQACGCIFKACGTLCEMVHNSNPSDEDFYNYFIQQAQEGQK